MLIKGSDKMISFTAGCYSRFIELLCSSIAVLVQHDVVGQAISQVGMRDFCYISQIFSELLGVHILNRKECDGEKMAFLNL